MTFPNIIALGMPSGMEIIVILFIVLLLFGAKRLPELARSLGQAKKEFHKATHEATEEIQKLKEEPSQLTQSNKTDPLKKA